MIIELDTIFFRTDTKFYSKECSGQKPYTIRLLSEDDAAMVISRFAVYKDVIKYIHITEAMDSLIYAPKSFKRLLTDISVIDHLLGKVVVGFSWKN